MTIEVTAPLILIWVLVGVGFLACIAGIAKTVLHWKIMTLRKRRRHYDPDKSIGND